MPSPHSLRHEPRGNAGFAFAAVALLVLGGAAALYLQAANLRVADERAAGVADAQALALDVEREGPVLDGVAAAALSDALGTGSPALPADARELKPAFDAALASRLALLYPRTTGDGHRLDALLLFARFAPVEAQADLPSPLGGRAALSAPAYLSVEGAADVSAEGRGGTRTAFVAFSAESALPLLLPASFAARFALEAGPGGRVERLVSQAAQRLAPARAVNASLARELVSFGLEAELALDFGASGNQTLDGRLALQKAGAGAFTVRAFFNGTDGPTEPFDLGPLGLPVPVAGQPRAVRLAPHGLATDRLRVNATWTYYDGQEVDPAVWSGLRLTVSGQVTFYVSLDAAAGSADLGPFEVPVSLAGRAMAKAPPDHAVPDALLEAGLGELAAKGTASRFAPTLLLGGVKPNATGVFPVDNWTRALVALVLARDAASTFPPVESTLEFERAWSAPVAGFQPGELLLDAPVPVEGARAVLSVDGFPAASAVVQAGAIRLERLPAGVHTVEARIAWNGSVLQGRAAVAVNASPFRAQLWVAPVVPSAFLEDAVARGEGAQSPAGLAILEEAAWLAGLGPPTDLGTVAQASAFARRTLERLDALEASRIGPRLDRARLTDAQGFLKIAVGLLDAADASYKSSTGRDLPIGGAAGAVAVLAWKNDPSALITVIRDGVMIAKAVATPDALQVTFLRGEAPPLVLKFGVDHLLLLANALGGFLTFTADVVKIERAFAPESHADAGAQALSVFAAGRDFAKLAVEVARLVYTLRGSEALKAVMPGLLRLNIAVSAAFLIFDLASAYERAGGNLSRMVDELLHPESISDLLQLPQIVGGAAGVVFNLFFLSGSLAGQGGPLGLAIGLFVLAALLVANKEKVASAIWGTLPYGALDEVRGQVGVALNISFAGAAAANAVDLGALTGGVRAAGGAAALSWLKARADGDGRAAGRAQNDSGRWLERARALALLRQGALALRASAVALTEELDDLASPAYSSDAGRFSEGYGYHYEPLKEIQYRGNVVVTRLYAGGLHGNLTRPEWRALEASVLPGDLSRYTFSFDLTETNGIPQSEFNRWSDKVRAASDAFKAADALIEDAARALGAASV